MRASSLILVLLLGGCVATSPDRPKEQLVPMPETYSEVTGSVSVPDNGQWWTDFRDPVLNRAIDEGLAGNLDLQAAVQRISEAESNVVVAGSGGLPTLTFDTSFTRTRQTGEMKEVAGWVDKSLYSVSANWLIDVFGEVRSQVRSARASQRAVVETAAVVRLALLADISAAYIDARYFQEMGAIASRAAESHKHTLQLTLAQERQGIGSVLDVEKTRQALAEAEADMPVIDGNFRRAENRLSTLMGKPANAASGLLEGFEKQPVPAFAPDTGYPADLVRNRPDIRKAEAELEAAVADIGYARSQLYPSITLSGSITPSYISTNVKSGNLTTWSFGPALRLPIFEGGRLRANVKIAASRAKQKELAWRQSVLKAVEEVENALVAFNREKSAIQKLQEQAKLSKRTVYLAGRSYSEGMTSLLNVLDTERQMLQVEIKLAGARRNLALQFVALNIAVGRGLPDADVPGEAPSSSVGQSVVAQK